MTNKEWLMWQCIDDDNMLLKVIFSHLDCQEWCPARDFCNELGNDGAALSCEFIVSQWLNQEHNTSSDGRDLDEKGECLDDEKTEEWLRENLTHAYSKGQGTGSCTGKTRNENDCGTGRTRQENATHGC